MEDHTLVSVYLSDFNSTYIHESSKSLDSIILLSVIPVEIIVGVLANSWALAVIIRRRLWLQHEGYVFLGAILITSALILALHYGSSWFWFFDSRYDITRTSDFLCKAFNFFFNGFHSTGLLVLALLFSICLRKGVERREDEEARASYYRPSIYALIVASTLIIVTLLMNIWQLVCFKLREYYNAYTYTKENYCFLADDWVERGLYWNQVAALAAHGLAIVFILPVLFYLIACSGCSCRPTGCKFGDNSRGHFPRVSLLSLAGIIQFLEFPATVYVLFGALLFYSYRFYMLAILVDGFVHAVMPILCIVTMPELREATFKADCSSCGHGQTVDVEAIAMSQAGGQETKRV